jgi:hypothetical protein
VNCWFWEGPASLLLPFLHSSPLLETSRSQRGTQTRCWPEIASQLQRAVMGLGSNPPQGNARQLAAMYRMASAWARSNNLDARVRERLDAALASEGHHAFVTRLASLDGLGEARRRGLPMVAFLTAVVIWRVIQLRPRLRAVR